MKALDGGIEVSKGFEDEVVEDAVVLVICPLAADVMAEAAVEDVLDDSALDVPLAESLLWLIALLLFWDG